MSQSMFTLSCKGNETMVARCFLETVPGLSGKGSGVFSDIQFWYCVSPRVISANNSSGAE